MIIILRFLKKQVNIKFACFLIFIFCFIKAHSQNFNKADSITKIGLRNFHFYPKKINFGIYSGYIYGTFNKKKLFDVWLLHPQIEYFLKKRIAINAYSYFLRHKDYTDEFQLRAYNIGAYLKYNTGFLKNRISLIAGYNYNQVYTTNQSRVENGTSQTIFIGYAIDFFPKRLFGNINSHYSFGFFSTTPVVINGNRDKISSPGGFGIKYYLK